jgi:N-acetyl-gamma-glutamylphosphate reductase
MEKAKMITREEKAEEETTEKETIDLELHTRLQEHYKDFLEKMGFMICQLSLDGEEFDNDNTIVSIMDDLIKGAKTMLMLNSGVMRNI